MKPLFFLTILSLSLISNSNKACTTFLINSGDEIVFGRNYDFVIGNGIVFINKKGVVKTALASQNAASWTSKYGSVTFNQFGREFPTGGINEAGLVVELMWLDDTKYPEVDNRPATGGVLQWIQYQLDNCETIQEVIDTDKDIRIPQAAVPLHFLIADKYGNAATIEFLDGKLKAHHSDEMEFEVLTNDTYDRSIEYFRNNVIGNEVERNSLNRFATACSMIKEYKNASGRNAVDYAFKILKDVDQGEHTKWSIVYDIKNMKIYFKTFENQNLKDIEIRAFDFNCSAPVKMLDVDYNFTGNINSLMEDYSYEANRKLIQDSYSGVDFLKNETQEDIDKAAKYPDGLKCSSKSELENKIDQEKDNIPYEIIFPFSGILLTGLIFAVYRNRKVKK